MALACRAPLPSSRKSGSAPSAPDLLLLHISKGRHWGPGAFATPDDDVPTVPFGRAEQAEGVRHGIREIHGPRPRFRAICAIAGAARRPPAIRPRAHPQGAARRSRGARRRPDRPFRGPLPRGTRRGRGEPCQASQSFRGRRGAALSRAGNGARVRCRAKSRGKGRRRLCDGRAAAARARARQGERGRQDPFARGRDAAKSQRRDQCLAQGPYRR